jgi:hypothetical protein
MTINYGKRNLGAGTASSPGDTLYIPLNFYNDSGASISIGTSLAVTDIEVFKDGGVAQRATDSGYAIMGDTGNFDSRIGTKVIKIQLFNTADDASFYAVGSSYQVMIDSVTVDARTVRFFPAVFEIGEPRANVVQVNGDTGAASVLQQFSATGGTLSPTGGFDTGSVDNNSYLTADAKRISGDTGAADVLRKFAATNGTLSPAGELDTGSVTDGSVIHANARRVNNDTGAASVLGQFAGTNGTLSPTGELDTGSVANSSYLPANVTRWLGTAAAAPTVAGVPKVEVSSFADTGVNDRLAKILADTDTGIQSSVTATNVTGFSDTGVNSRLTTIQGKTDSLTFTVAGNVDANIQRVNDVAVSGTGAAGDEWGP